MIPSLSLATGQVAWALWYPRTGRPADAPKSFLARLLYLRRHGVPFAEGEDAPGSGHELAHDFFHLAELAIAMELLDGGVKPSDAAMFLVSRRSTLRRFCVEAFERREEKDSFDDPRIPSGYGLFLEVTIVYDTDEPRVLGPHLRTPSETTARLMTTGNKRFRRTFIALSGLLDLVVRRATFAPGLKRGRRPVSPGASKNTQRP